jgi:hypothetical protein
VKITCINCGAEIEDTAAVCPSCGERRRSRYATVPPWQDRRERRRSSFFGLVLALVCVAGLAWIVFTNLGRSGAPSFTGEDRRETVHLP